MAGNMAGRDIPYKWRSLQNRGFTIENPMVKEDYYGNIQNMQKSKASNLSLILCN